MKSLRAHTLKAFLLLTLFISTHIYSIGQSLMVDDLSIEMILDLETDVEEEINDTGDLEKDETYSFETDTGNYSMIREKSIRPMIRFFILRSYPVSTPPPETL